jgi:hypothetical protein
VVTLKLIGEMQDRLPGANRDALASLEQRGAITSQILSPSLPHVFSYAHIQSSGGNDNSAFSLSHMPLQTLCTKVAECLARSYSAEFRARLPLLPPSTIYGTEFMHLGDDVAC